MSYKKPKTVEYPASMGLKFPWKLIPNLTVSSTQDWVELLHESCPKFCDVFKKVQKPFGYGSAFSMTDSEAENCCFYEKKNF